MGWGKVSAQLTPLSVLRIVGQWLWKISEMITEKEVETKPVTLQHFRVRISHGVPWSSTCTLLFVYFIHLQVHSDKNIKLFTLSLISATITINSFFVTFTFLCLPTWICNLWPHNPVVTSVSWSLLHVLHTEVRIIYWVLIVLCVIQSTVKTP